MNAGYPQFVSPFVQWLYDWQTLIGAILALGAAFIALEVSRRHNNAQLEQAQEAQRRQFRAARSTLALSLSALTDYLKAAGVELAPVHAPAANLGLGNNNLGFVAPRLPSEIVRSLERMVETADTDELGDRVHGILSDLQIFQSRIGELENPPPHRVGIQREIENHLIQAARIYRDVGDLFPFARGEAVDERAGTYMGTLRFAFDLDELQFANVYANANELDAEQAQHPDDGSAHPETQTSPNK